MSSTAIGTFAEPKVQLAQRQPLVEERRTKPIRLFAGIGAFFVVLQGYVYLRWILSGNATPTSSGPDEVPHYMKVTIIAHEIVAPLLLILCVYWYIVRPWRRDSKIGLYGLLLPSFLSMYWQDIASNYFNHFFTYNSWAFNLGAWYNFIPGWGSPRANHLAEPLLILAPLYVAAMLPPAIFVAFLMRKSKERWPQLGKSGLIFIAFVAMAVFDFAIEVPWVISGGLWVYAGSIPAITLFSGHYYQFPIWEPILASAFFFAPFAVLLYFRDDKGYTFVERGLEDLRTNTRRKTGMRMLAFVGFANLVFISYNVSAIFLSLIPGYKWAEDLENRSYFRDQVCGAGTTYACPNRDLPIPRRDGPHVSPTGDLIRPS